MEEKEQLHCCSLKKIWRLIVCTKCSPSILTPTSTQLKTCPSRFISRTLLATDVQAKPKNAYLPTNLTMEKIQSPIKKALGKP